MENIEFYKYSNCYYFLNNTNKDEGKIILTANNRGGEIFMQISHLEDCENLTEKEQDDYLDLFKDNLNLILNAKSI